MASRHVAQLESHLGVRLLNRTTRRLSLTPEGERYLEDGEAILRDIERLERSLAASRERPQGLLRINAGFRITSYNVCYTKLLRKSPGRDGAARNRSRH